MLPWSRPGRGADRNMRQMSCHLPDEDGCVAEVPLPGHTAAGLLSEAHWPQVQLTQVQLAHVHSGLPQLRSALPQLHSAQLHGSQVHAGFSQVVGVLMTVFSLSSARAAAFH
jgi:hypothetical protein